MLNKDDFEIVEREFEAVLIPLCFGRLAFEYGGAFGSHYVDRVLGDLAYRLISDGRESAVILDTSKNYRISVEQRVWKTLFWERLQAPITQIELGALKQKVVESLRSSLSTDFSYSERR
jgi:hypothetical protein